MSEQRCMGCNRVLREGDTYIEDTASGFTGAKGDAVVDDLVASIWGGSTVVFCTNCTKRGGHYGVKVYHEESRP